MSAGEDNLLSRRCFEEVFTTADLAVGDELCAAGEQEALAKKIFGLALALATEPSKLAQLRQMPVHLQEQYDCMANRYGFTFNMNWIPEFTASYNLKLNAS